MIKVIFGLLLKGFLVFLIAFIIRKFVKGVEHTNTAVIFAVALLGVPATMKLSEANFLPAFIIVAMATTVAYIAMWIKIWLSAKGR